MDSLAEEIWDVVIAGTSLPQSLLALSLSRSRLNILHVDSKKYYGGSDAGLSTSEAQNWAVEHKDEQNSTINATVDARLASSKSYTLSLNPQIIYASSPLLPSMVTSRIHDQLDFLAVGSWWISRDGKLDRIPSTREDVFADESLSRRDKIGLMKFLRSVAQDESAESSVEFGTDALLQDTLSASYKIPANLQSALAALALVNGAITDVAFETAVKRIRRHMTSMGYFGPGFAAVYPKYAGSAEISQVTCRAGAVGGAVYLLNYGVSSISSSKAPSDVDLLSVELSDGTTVRARRIVGDVDSLPKSAVTAKSAHDSAMHVTFRSIAIVSDPLKHLFAQTTENSPTPAVTIVSIDDSNTNSSTSSKLLPPIYLQIHSEDTGECPSGQCIIYATLQIDPSTSDLQASRDRLEAAVQTFLTHQNSLRLQLQPESQSQAESEQTPTSRTDNIQTLWTMTYTTTGPPISTAVSTEPFLQDDTGRIIAFSPRTQDIAFDDQVLSSVKAVWTEIMGGQADIGEFLCFEDRNRGELDQD